MRPLTKAAGVGMERNLFSRNALLGAIEPHLRPEASAKLKSLPLDRGDILYSQGAPLDRVFFPLTGLVGILAETADGDRMDTALVGREGAIGVFEACGSRQFFAEAQVKVEGEGAAMSAEAYRELFEASGSLRTAVHRYVEQLMSETRQSVVCGSLHSAEQRLSRILLEALEKSATGRTLPLTQATLARILGAQRTTIAELLARMQRGGALTTGRRAITIDDFALLERMACSCRESIRFAKSAIWAADAPSCEEAMVAAE